MLNKNTIVDLFSEQVKKVPDHIAIVFEDAQLTYGELNQKSNQLAHFLIQKNVLPNDRVAISTDRSIDTIIALLAILKTGSSYVPIEISYPKDRIHFIVENSETKYLIVSKKSADIYSDFQDKMLVVEDALDQAKKISDEDLILKTEKDRLTYILHTSGTTGTPKGVCMGQNALVNLIQWQKEKSVADEETKTLQFSPLSFDVSFQEIFATLTTGGSLILISEDLRLDPLRLLNLIAEQNINRIFLPFVALQSITESAVASEVYPIALKEVMTAGEQLKITPQIVKFFSKLPNAVLYNQYGPTEAHVVTEFKLSGNPEKWPALPCIGKAIYNTKIFILDENLNEVVDGEVGELCISGLCLADGYLNLPEMTTEKFTFSPKSGIRIYRTGDHARFLPDGNIECLGRADHQVKIRGHRVELGEIEVVITQQPDIAQVAVILREDFPGRKVLVAYLIGKEQNYTGNKLRTVISKSLPDYMVPTSFVWLPEFPKTTSGKVDRKALPKPDTKRPETNIIYKKPSTEKEKKITEILIAIFGYDKIGVNDSFFEIGGNSLLAQKTVAELKQQFGYNLPVTKLYQYPTIAEMATYLDKNPAREKISAEKPSYDHSRDVAIIGMAGKFPGANTIEDFWNLLLEGKETTTFFTQSDIDPGIPDHIKNDPSYVKARGIIKDVDKFDPAFFGINSKLAELMDPQQRIFLEISWEILEKTGYLPSKYNGKIGVFAGSGNNTYYENNVLSHPDLIENQGKIQVSSVNEKDYIASRTAYHLNLKGPAVSVNSACSTSLLAIAQAVNSLRANQCEIAIAGGSSITSPVNSGHIYQEGSMLSANGHCTPFDDGATGTVFSDGAGVVLLKNLDSAINDHDKIYAVIKGVGINNDGFGKGSFTAPSAEGQADAIASAISDAGVEAAEISYIEAHGTGTPIGDPIELEGLVDAFGYQNRKQFCAIGSVKSNFGHLTHAAGVAGLIKTSLALHHKKIPASLGYKIPNHNIDFNNSPFYVNDKLTDWNTSHKRIAGISSFGVGGTNVHLVVESYENVPEEVSENNAVELITWSANSETSRDTYAAALLDYLTTNPDTNLSDLGYTLRKTRDNFKYRRFLVANSIDELKKLLAIEKVNVLNINTLQELPEEIVFTFPGQGAQYLNMGLDLYLGEPVYRAAIDTCAGILRTYIHEDIRSIIYPEVISDAANAKLKDTRYTQPALFVTEYALAKLWISWGIHPALLCGHSIGEYVAGHLSGIFSLEDGLKMVTTRGKLISELPAGSMLSIGKESDSVTKFLSGDLSIAAINSPKACVVAGPTDQISALSTLLNENEIASKLLFTSHAFHSSMMDPILDEYRSIVDQVTLSIPKIPIVSTVTGNLLTDEEATNPDYWTSQLRKTVQFSKAVETMLNKDLPLFLEVGPGTVTSTLIRQIAAFNALSTKTIPSFNHKDADHYSLLSALGQLWINGIEPNWNDFYANQKRSIINLPSYQFERNRYWVNPIVLKSDFSENQIPIEQIKHIIPINTALMRKTNLTHKVKQVLEDASGIEMNGIESNRNFLEIGLDSLLLTQVAISLKREFNLPITFRKLNEEYPSIETLVDYLDKNTPQDSVNNSESLAPPINHIQQPAYVSQAVNDVQQNGNSVSAGDSALSLIAQQLEILSKQVMLMQGSTVSVHQNATPQPIAVNGKKIESADTTTNSELSQEEKAEIQKPFGATPKIERLSTDLDEKQLNFIKELTDRYNKKTLKSKTYASNSRSFMADPRVVSGFRPTTKELVYPIVINKSSGSKLWDIDGNEYIDALNGFGSNMLGYQPEVIKHAMHEQIEKGYEVGPQHELAADVSKLICEFTGFDRAALCSTGSEAVLGCIRIARTVTGRPLIVAFSGSYHGIIDEVLVRGTKKLKSFPAAAGIMPEAVHNILVLDYGTDETLAIIKERAGEIAAVLVEPIQSRRPEFVPIDFLKKVREITTDAGTALIFDEVITGFRMHPGGAQALFGIKADLASYGKVIGGGVPIGVIGGKSYLMDALDGGNWNYGDHSYPEIGVTYFAGTFVRHPLALASAKASLTYMKEKGPALQQGLSEKGVYLTKALNSEFEKRQLPIYVANYGSLWKIKYHEELPYSELMFVLMREKGIHILDGFPCFLTEAITYQEIDKIISCFIDSMEEMINAGFFPSLDQTIVSPKSGSVVIDGDNPPVKGAKLGKDKSGNPAWFVEDPNHQGKYLQIELN
ncbi:MAG: amino acid adenylation domain-containing protein [Candidatus Pedobacter colombiensis]|uniref:Amino acid adenylation domain-containing protein n=1 Tax=Candidatus Pedobacter colombiensis TaxID=3121371 RepID=A0AAJ5WB45_9SPHI|nr:polyketide synthase [Pedobacter sp.]WEK21234.1 MAG: amino acid adenylation domain-containing protein [Pedobacter sp.]